MALNNLVYSVQRAARVLVLDLGQDPWDKGQVETLQHHVGGSGAVC